MTAAADTTRDATATYDRWNRKLNASWSSADYARIGVTLQITGERLAEAAGIGPGATVLDVAAGNGNASLAFARRFARVTSTDYVPEMLDRGRERARAEGLEIDFRTADAHDLCFADQSFDGVVSTFGVMFAPDQPRAAAELVRVCRPGGRIALTAWTPQGFIGRLCATVGRHMGAGPGFPSPQNWGREEWLMGHFGTDCDDIWIKRRVHNFRYLSPQHFLDYFRAHYGLVSKAFEVVGKAGADALARDIVGVAERFNTASDGTLCAPSEYLEAVMVRR